MWYNKGVLKGARNQLPKTATIITAAMPLLNERKYTAMTMRTFYENVANGLVNDEMKLMAAKLAADPKVIEAAEKTAQDEELMGKIREILSDGITRPAVKLAEALNVTTAKVSALARKMADLKVTRGIATGESGREGVVNFYGIE